MTHPRSGFAAPPQGGDAGGPAEPDPRRPLGDAMRVGRRTVLSWPVAIAASLAGCRPSRSPLQGGWVGASHERGHAWRDGRLPRADAGRARRVDVAIVGAGVAGLSVARALRRSGVEDLRLFELEDHPGGNSRGHQMGGMACPLGAHYLPTPGPHARAVSEWLFEIGVARHELGRTVYDERHLCHAPQERLFIGAQWQDGLLPVLGASADTLAQYRRFAQVVRELQAAHPFRLPTAQAPWTAGLAALDAQPFGQWLQSQGLGDAWLRGYLDYCCRDDYGAGLDQVSAWAGLHYFASRHGFHAAGEDDANGEREAVLTWPEGNAWLVQRLAAGLGERLQTGAVLTRVSPAREAVTLDLWNAAAQQPERWLAKQVVMCVPLFIAARLIDAPPAGLPEAAAGLRYAPWLVSNLQLDAPLLDRLGAPPAWDNVVHGSATLGYVDAQHQSLRPVRGATVLTHYWALGGRSPGELKAQRQRLLSEPWQHWAQAVVDELSAVHPDLPEKLQRIDLMRYGHAMSIPAPGLRSGAALAALAQPQGRLHFAHADLSGYSVFEEAFTWGAAVGAKVARSSI